MNINLITDALTRKELLNIAPPLFALESGKVSSIDEIVDSMCSDGVSISDSYPRKGGLSIKSSSNTRPKKEYWPLVKDEFRIFLCTNNDKYTVLWKKLAQLEDKSTTTIVAVISAYMGSKIGVEGGLLSGLVAVCLFGMLKIGKEAFCQYISETT
jgi:tetrahydromethanopterin S-methyltransferase subunit G